MTIHTQESLAELLLQLEGWQIIDAALEKSFVFDDFKQALAFIVKIGILFEQADHHAAIHNVYNRVTLRLNTHSVSAITDKDTNMASNINALLESRG